MSDCRFGVPPVNYPDPDPDPLCRRSNCNCPVVNILKTCKEIVDYERRPFYMFLL